MAQDPVCKMEVDESKSEHTSAHMGKTYYFCCEACKSEFDKNPGKYTGMEGTKKHSCC